MIDEWGELMYHYNFKVIVLSEDTSLYEKIAALPSLEGFTNEVSQTCKVDASLQAADLLVCAAPARVLEQALSLLVPGKAMKVYLGSTKEQDLLSESALAQLDELWTLPITERLLDYRLHKLFAHIKAIKDAHLTQNYLESLINGIPPLIWYKDIRGAHLKVNNSFCVAVGKEKSDIEGRGHYYIWDLKPEEYAKGEYVCLETEQEVLEAKKTLLFEEKVKTKRGLRQFRTYKSPIWDDNHELIGTVGCAIDVTDEKSFMAQLIGAAETDDLTSLYNRRYFYKYVGGNNVLGKPLNVFYIDLDNFKKINDRYGHQTGDDLLHQVARILEKIFSDGLCFRFGGDEFVVTLQGERTKEELAGYAERFLTHLGELVAANDTFAGLSASIGIAVTEALEDVDALLRKSDRAMYEAKESSKRVYKFAN